MNFSTTFSVLFVYFVGRIKAWIINQPRALQTVQHGDSVTIQCYLPKKDFNTMLWYRQKLGMKPEPMAHGYNYLQDVTYSEEFKRGRFIVSTGKGFFHLSITATSNEDTASYFCGVIALNELHFGSGTLLIVKGFHFSSQATLKNPSTDPLYPGGSVTLNCSVHNMKPNCTQPPLVYWFKGGSQKILYMHENSSDRCEKMYEDNSPVHTCVYKLPKKNLSLSDGGTYYCAVAACGEILFGNGNKLNIVDINHPETVNISYFILITSNIISAVVMIILIAIRCKRQSLLSGSSKCDTSSDTQVVCDDALNYAALTLTEKAPSSRGSRRQQKIKDCAVYTQVKYDQQS